MPHQPGAGCSGATYYHLIMLRDLATRLLRQVRAVSTARCFKPCQDLLRKNSTQPAPWVGTWTPPAGGVPKAEEGGGGGTPEGGAPAEGATGGEAPAEGAGAAPEGGGIGESPPAP